MKYIDADKAKNGIMKFVNEYGEIVGMFVNDFNILLERCAVDAQEVRHGEWEYGETVVHSGDGYLLGVGCRCSVCHKPPFVICGTLVKTDYCPFCGALMVNKDE